MKKLLIVCVVLFSSIGSLYSQNKSIKGRVIAQNLDILPYTQILIKDTVEVGKTDLNGFFQIEIPFSVKKIKFTFIGVEVASIELKNYCKEVEVVMVLSCTCDFMTLKKVDRFRNKSYKRLPEIHKDAFEKGIFKTQRACYYQEFIPYYSKKVR